MTPQIKREALPVMFKIVADAERELTELTGSRISLKIEVSDGQPITEKEALKLNVQKLVAAEFDVPWAQIISNSRKRQLVDAKKAYSYIMNICVGQILRETADDLHMKEHTSIVYLRENARQLMAVNDPIKRKILNIKTKLYEHFS